MPDVGDNATLRVTVNVVEAAGFTPSLTATVCEPAVELGTVKLQPVIALPLTVHVPNGVVLSQVSVTLVPE